MSKNESKQEGMIRYELKAVQDIFFVTQQNKVIRISSDDIPLMSLLNKNGKQKSRKPKGVKVIDLKKGDKLTGITSTTIDVEIKRA